ncbi:hypothetical protein DFH06DRAFT_661354 [Mycena polygramma]|nr:hypothetical protein DFH06DRAFT_661354 [Mycena polygramma]
MCATASYPPGAQRLAAAQPSSLSSPLFITADTRHRPMKLQRASRWAGGCMRSSVPCIVSSRIRTVVSLLLTKSSPSDWWRFQRYRTSATTHRRNASAFPPAGLKASRDNIRLSLPLNFSLAVAPSTLGAHTIQYLTIPRCSYRAAQVLSVIFVGYRSFSATVSISESDALYFVRGPTMRLSFQRLARIHLEGPPPAFPQLSLRLSSMPFSTCHVIPPTTFHPHRKALVPSDLIHRLTWTSALLYPSFDSALRGLSVGSHRTPVSMLLSLDLRIYAVAPPLWRSRSSQSAISRQCHTPSWLELS